MEVNNLKIEEILIKTKDDELVGSITDENVIVKDGYVIEYIPKDKD